MATSWSSLAPMRTTTVSCALAIATRLSALIDAGRLAAEGDRASVRTYGLRRRGGGEEG